MMDHRPHHYAEKLTRFREYAEALEEERRKIEVFQRELPLCLQLVTQAIESCRHQMQSGFYSDCEETSSEDRGPVLEEFIPIKRTSEDTELQQRQENQEQSNNDRLAIKKRDWLMSVSLWNQEEDPFAKEKSGQKSMVVEMKKKGAFHPFCRDKSSPAIGALPPPASVVPTVAASSSTAETNGGEEKEGDQSQRKTRRCWSPELHRRFLHALQQLGGSHVATPKQIRELMKVDGLTNDEVKSHLQKYRLHTRRPSAAMQSSNAQHTQFVVVGGIWVPPELAPAAAQSTEATQIYAPVAALPPQLQQKKTERSPTGPLHDDGEEHSVGDDVNSSHTPASSSSRTTSPSLF